MRACVCVRVCVRACARSLSFFQFIVAKPETKLEYELVFVRRSWGYFNDWLMLTRTSAE